MWQSMAMPADARQKLKNRNANILADLVKVTENNIGQIQPGDVVTLFLGEAEPLALVRVKRVYSNALDGDVKYAHEKDFGSNHGYPLGTLYMKPVD